MERPLDRVERLCLRFGQVTREITQKSLLAEAPFIAIEHDAGRCRRRRKFLGQGRIIFASIRRSRSHIDNRRDVRMHTGAENECPAHVTESHLKLNRTGTVRSTRSPGNSGGGGGKGCARCKRASASSSSAVAPDERTTRLSITRPWRSRLKKTWAVPCCSARACARYGVLVIGEENERIGLSTGPKTTAGRAKIAEARLDPIHRDGFPLAARKALHRRRLPWIVPHEPDLDLLADAQRFDARSFHFLSIHLDPITRARARRHVEKRRRKAWCR
jgi:hypothetical protein